MDAINPGTPDIPGTPDQRFAPDAEFESLFAEQGGNGLEHAGRGSAWAALDDTFYEIVDGLFTPTFRLGADTLLATNDASNASDATAEARRAAMRRHPSSRRPR